MNSPLRMSMSFLAALVIAAASAIALSARADEPASTQRIDLIEAAGLPEEMLGSILQMMQQQLGKTSIDLNITILDAAGAPYAEQNVRLIWQGGESDLRTDSAGKLVAPITAENRIGAALLVPAGVQVMVSSPVKLNVGAKHEAPEGAAEAPMAAPLSPRFKTGDSVPTIKAETYINAPDGFSPDWEKLGDRIVILEFWETWCAPCVAAIPHMNKLVDRFADRGVVLISVTDESDKLILPFLETHPMKGVVAMDTDRSILTDFGVRFWPQAYIIRRGKVLAAIHPAMLKDAMIEAALAGKPVPDATPEADPAAEGM